MPADRQQTGTSADHPFAMANNQAFASEVHLTTGYRVGAHRGKIGIRASLHRLICVGIVVGMLAVGLGPFQSPRNGVSWLPDRNGVRFDRHASILSDGTFDTAGPSNESTSSVEIWLRPDQANRSSTIFAFFIRKGLVPFSLQQFFSSLCLRLPRANEYGQITACSEGVLHKQKPVFITITSDTRRSAIFTDGVLADEFAGLPLGRATAGQLILGTSPTGQSDWYGELLGLAFYNRQLTDEEIVRHYRTWTRKGRPEVGGREGLVALYLLNERGGNIIHDSRGTGLSLSIPEKYTVLQQLFLQPFWTEYKLTAGYFKDALINVVGFIPLGFVYFTYWTVVKPIKRAVAATIGIGFALSLTIEIVQSLLPTRNSGTTDLITNTLGTYLGVKLCASHVVRFLLQKAHIS